MIRVTLEGLIRRNHHKTIVDGATLEIRPRELACLLGPAGSGKTTLARLIAGLEPLDDGEIFFDERLVHKLPPHERRVGLVFQEEALWPRLTVAENVGYGLKVRGIARVERLDRVAEALNALHLDSLAGKRPNQLSPLQRRRAALARALAIAPELLVLDEPLERLDPRERDEFRDDVRRVHAETGVTTLVLTRDPSEALVLADRLSVMDAGRVLQTGSPHEVYNRPADAFVARLLGPTNLVQGHVEGSDGRGEVIVRTPIGRLVGLTATPGALTEGAPVTLAIRPEALALGSFVLNANRFNATIERLVFEGETRRVHLRAPGDWPVTALTLQCQSQALRAGQNVMLSVSPELVVVLPGNYAVMGNG